MKVIITGDQGYIGWPTVIKLLRQGHEVIGIDNDFREKAVYSVDSGSIIPLGKQKDRIKFAKQLGRYKHINGDVASDYTIREVIKEHRPDYIIHLAAHPSAPYSMIDNSVTNFTLTNNCVGTMNILWGMKEYSPKSTLIFASTMGVYGQPNYRIPQDGLLNMDIEQKGDDFVWSDNKSPIPYRAGSFYHLSKTLDEQNILFASKQWNLKSLILRQGVVFGNVLRNFEGYDNICSKCGNPLDSKLVIDPALSSYPTRFDIDKYFGTAFNRFVAQAIMGYGITLYGEGQQTRAFVTLNHAVDDLVGQINMNALTLNGGVIRNSVTKCFNLSELAGKIKQVVEENLSIKVDIRHVENPRKEKEKNDLIMEESPRELDLELEIRTMINMLKPHQDRFEKYKDVIL